MKPRPALALGLLPLTLLTSCGGAPAAPQARPTATTGLVRLTLPPAWTETPTVTLVPPTATATPTVPAAVLAARQTATAWPTLHVVAVGGGVDPSTWQRFDFGDGSVLLPPSFAEQDLRRLDTAVETSLRSYAAGLAAQANAVTTPVSGQPTPSSLDDLAASGFHFAAARDRAAAADLFIVSGPVPSGFDGETLMTRAFGSLAGEAEVNGRETIGGAPLPTVRLHATLYDRNRGTIEPRVYYITIVGDRMWTLIFRARDFEDSQSLFETSALSLTPP
ncbi:MAG TPA: hypothetical protein VK449_06240 [Anaerolineales bacterium]|nr:hypothetical protein [Anaerolineales bacterium]